MQCYPGFEFTIQLMKKPFRKTNKQTKKWYLNVEQNYRPLPWVSTSRAIALAREQQMNARLCGSSVHISILLMARGQHDRIASFS